MLALPAAKGTVYTSSGGLPSGRSCFWQTWQIGLMGACRLYVTQKPPRAKISDTRRRIPRHEVVRLCLLPSRPCTLDECGGPGLFLLHIHLMQWGYDECFYCSENLDVVTLSEFWFGCCCRLCDVLLSDAHRMSITIPPMQVRIASTLTPRTLCRTVPRSWQISVYDCHSTYIPK
jgi:hypothetical protein